MTDTGPNSDPIDAAAETRDPSQIMQVGMGFWPSKTLLSAVELGLFTLLGSGHSAGLRSPSAWALAPERWTTSSTGW